MSKSEEIEEALTDWANDICLYDKEDCIFMGEYGYCVCGDELYKCLMRRLDSYGVVIKKDGELPTPTVSYDLLGGWIIARRDMIDAGYTLTERLIDESAERKNKGYRAC